PGGVDRAAHFVGSGGTAGRSEFHITTTHCLPICRHTLPCFGASRVSADNSDDVGAGSRLGGSQKRPQLVRAPDRCAPSRGFKLLDLTVLAKTEAAVYCALATIGVSAGAASERARMAQLVPAAEIH